MSDSQPSYAERAEAALARAVDYEEQARIYREQGDFVAAAHAMRLCNETFGDAVSMTTLT